MRADKYTALQIDVLRELANIGGGNAATSISSFIDKPIQMSVPRVEILDYEEVFQDIMNQDTMVNAVLMRMMGDARGYFLFVASQKDAYNLINMMMPNNQAMSEGVQISALKELVNIIVNTYLNAITKILNVNLIASVPMFTIDMFGAILSSAYMEVEQYDDNILIMNNEFQYQNNKIEGSLYFIPAPGVLRGMFNIIGV